VTLAERREVLQAPSVVIDGAIRAPGQGDLVEEGGDNGAERLLAHLTIREMYVGRNQAMLTSN
jgi:hypothetical protein